MQARTIAVDGVRMRWEEAGEGEPVVLVHGIPTSPRLWRYVVPRLRGARALAWEMVGYGGSIAEGRGREIGVARQADYLAAWMRALDLHRGARRALVVGHDLGGGVAQVLAVRHPELVGGLVLTNAICYDSWPIPSVRLLRALAPLVARLPEPVLRAQLYVGLMLRAHDRRDRAREWLGEHWRYYREAAGGAAAALVRQVRSLDSRDTLAVADALPRLDVPALLVWGAADPFQTIDYGERLARDLRAPLDRVEGGRHFVPEDHPDRLAAAIGALAGVPLPAG